MSNIVNISEVKSQQEETLNGNLMDYKNRLKYEEDRQFKYYHQELKPFLESIVSEYAEIDDCQYILSYVNLPIIQQIKLIKHMFIYKNYGLEPLYETTENSYKELSEALFELILSQETDEKLCFSSLVIKKVEEFFEDEMNDLLREVCVDLSNENFSHENYNPDLNIRRFI